MLKACARGDGWMPDRSGGCGSRRTEGDGQRCRGKWQAAGSQLPAGRPRRWGIGDRGRVCPAPFGALPRHGSGAFHAAGGCGAPGRGGNGLDRFRAAACQVRACKSGHGEQAAPCAYASFGGRAINRRRKRSLSADGLWPRARRPALRGVFLLLDHGTTTVLAQGQAVAAGVSVPGVGAGSAPRGPWRTPRGAPCGPTRNSGHFPAVSGPGYRALARHPRCRASPLISCVGSGSVLLQRISPHSTAAQATPAAIAVMATAALARSLAWRASSCRSVEM